MPSQLNPVDVLGERGRIAQRLKKYEHRAEQLQMAEGVARAIEDKSHLIVEAGTGVGKSFAYLVPAILAATASQGQPEGTPRVRVVVSTHTISLQEQLIGRDIPFLNSVLPVEFSAVLVKGRGNYISLRRMKAASDRAPLMFANEQPLDQVRNIVKWSKDTSDGSRSSLDFRPLAEVWDEVQSDSANCLGKKCGTYNDCFYFKARRRAWNADVLVVNHALFFSDLALRREGASILPDYDVVVFDEAHTLEAVAADHLGISVSNGQVEYLLNKLYNDRANRGLLVHYDHREGQDLVQALRFVSQEFFDSIRDWQTQRGAANGRLLSPPKVPYDLASPLRGLAATIAAFADKLTDEGKQLELTAAAERCVYLANTTETWLGQKISDAVYWTETSGRQQDRLQLLCAPVEVAPVLRAELFDKVKTVILTSATLAVGGQDFGFVKDRLGISRAAELKLGSPFDYRANAKLILPGKMPDPTENAQAYETAVCERIKRHVAETQGRAFVLFTSYRMLQNCASRLSAWFRENDYALFSQAEGMPRTLMLDRFRQDPRGVLFGADSFWQGVDVPGDALQNVIITKLPFSVPDHPLLEARLEAIRKRGGNPFLEYQVPEAIIKLKQGFGRLIRTKTDRGQVVILDPRVRTKRYGHQFLASLPDCRIEEG